MRRLLREPLVHFLLIGSMLFALWAVLGGSPGSDSMRVVVTKGHVATLTELFRRTWQRPPTRGELSGLVDDYVREEILYREALAMGLDRDDTIIRRRLRQKLEFVVLDLSATERPSDAALSAFLTANPDRFRREPALGFEHVYLSTDRRGASAQADAEALLDRLRDGVETGAAQRSSDPFDLPLHFESASPGEVRRSFGADFATTVAQLQPGTWQGPVASSYGLHLVRIHEREPGRLPPLEEIRDDVEREWITERRREANDELYRRLRERYSVEVLGLDDDDAEAPE